MFDTGRPKPDTPEGLIQLSNGETGFVRQLCNLPPKRLDIIGSDLVKDWSKYCEIPGETKLVPDTSPGCENTRVRLTGFVVEKYDSIFNGQPLVRRTELFQASWLPGNPPSLEIGANPGPEGGAALVWKVVDVACGGPVRTRVVTFVGKVVDGSGTVIEIVDYGFSIGEVFQRRNCCPRVEVTEVKEYIGSGRFTNSEVFTRLLPEILWSFVPLPAIGKVGRLARAPAPIAGLISVTRVAAPRLGTPLRTFPLASRGIRLRVMSPIGDNVVEALGRTSARVKAFQPARIAPTRPRPGTPLPTRELPSRRPKPAPAPAPKPRRSPPPSTPKRPGKPLTRPRPPLIRPKPIPPRIPNVPPPSPSPRTPNTPRPQPPRIPSPRPPNVPASPPVPTRPPSPSIPRRPSPARPLVPSPNFPAVPSPSPRPVPSPRPTPAPSPKPGRPPIPYPNRPGQPRPSPSPSPGQFPDRGLPRPLPFPQVPPWQTPTRPITPRPSPFPVPQTRPIPSPEPLGEGPLTEPFRPIVFPLPVVNPPKTTLEEFPEVPINQNPCPPCPTVIEIRNVPIMIPGPPGPAGKDGKDGEDGEGGSPVLLIDSKMGNGSFSQVLDFTGVLRGKTTGTFPRNISRITVRVLGQSSTMAQYGRTETGEIIGAFGTIALIVDDVIVHQYSLNRFSDCQLMVPQGRGQTVEVFVLPTVSCRVAVLDEGHRWVAVRVLDPENLPEMSASQIN